MSNKRNKGSNGSPVTCNKCGVQVASGTKNTSHRRCGGSADAPIRNKHNNLPGADRGQWQ